MSISEDQRDAIVVYRTVRHDVWVESSRTKHDRRRRMLVVRHGYRIVREFIRRDHTCATYFADGYAAFITTSNSVERPQAIHGRVVRVLSGPYDSVCSSVGDLIESAPVYECKHPWVDLLAAQVVGCWDDRMQLTIIDSQDVIADRWSFPSLAILWQDESGEVNGSILTGVNINEMDQSPLRLNRTTITISWQSAKTLGR